MWFYIPAIILIVAFVVWFRRTNLYRHHRRGHGIAPGQAGYHAAGSRYEGAQGTPEPEATASTPAVAADDEPHGVTVRATV